MAASSTISRPAKVPMPPAGAVAPSTFARDGRGRGARGVSVLLPLVDLEPLLAVTWDIVPCAVHGMPHRAVNSRYRRVLGVRP